ncbi:MAG: homoserine O-succinyltransferase [Clostridia bacterium]|nr:homoserine O-succinyltransferase [Clostridia bacterium]
MPIVIPKDLPAFDVLTKEKIFVMPSERAVSQDIRPIEIAIVNLMPTKIDTETQLMRLLGNSSLQINVTLVNMDTYISKNTPQSHMHRFYKVFDEIKDRHFDGMIITGAPVEQMGFEEVAYWKELSEIMTWSDSHVTSTIHICWGAQAGLHHHYGVTKHTRDSKLFGIYQVRAEDKYDLLLKGMNDSMFIPMSRHTDIDEDKLRTVPDLKVLASGKECGIAIVKSLDNKRFFFMGHSEYDRTTLKKEYLRDVDKGLDIERPVNYFEDDGLYNINLSWRSTAYLLFNNWLNYYVYQVTPYSFDEE